MCKKIFKNIISAEEYIKFNKDELEDFEQKNNIYIESNPPEYFNSIIFDNSTEIELEEFNKKLLNPSQNQVYSHKFLYHINPILVNEIYLTFLDIVNKDINEEKEIQVNKIDFELNYTINIEEKKDLIKNYISRYSNYLKKNKVLESYYSIFKNTEIENKKFSDFLKIYISTNKNIIDNYITKGKEVDYEDDFFLNWKNGIINTKIFKILNQRLSKYRVPISSTVTKDHQKDKYFSLIFKSNDAEQTFYNTLKEFGALNESNKPTDRKFQPVCESFFEVCKDNNNTISLFKPKPSKKHFIEHLNNKFNLKLTKLSDGSGYKNDMRSYFKNFIK